jgi:predicted anti-sigma-YlaC factor YlaD
MDHAVLTELAAGAALEDLDPVERARLDAHLAACPRCRALVLELEDVLGDLALAAPELRPPAALRGQVLERLHDPVVDGMASAVAPSVVPAVAQALAAVPRRGRALVTWGSLALAAVLAVVAVGLGARAEELDRELATVTAALAQVSSRSAEADAAISVAADPDHVSAALHAEALAPVATAVVLFRPGSTDAYLLATDLPPTPDGQVYQLWWADAAGVHALGTFRYDGVGPFVAPFGVDLADGAAAMVTLEPDGGATGEPGPQVVFGEF